MSPLFPALAAGPDRPHDRPALRFGAEALTYGELASAAGTLAGRISGAGRVAVWATPTAETAVRSEEHTSDSSHLSESRMPSSA